MYKLHLIRDLCRQKNMTLNELSEKVGITPSGLQNILSKNSTTQKRIEKIAQVLGVDVTVFLEASKNHTRNTISEPQENYGYKEKYISLLEEYNKLLKEKTECTKTNKYSESKK